MELRKVRKLLQALLDLAEQSSMTGVFSGGSATAVRRYNALLEHLEDEEMVPEDIFEQLDEDSTGFDRLGVEIKLLMGYLEEDEPTPKSGQRRDLGFLCGIAPFVDKEELTKLVEESIQSGARVDEGVIMGLAPFLDRRLIGSLLRRIVMDSARVPEPPEPPAPPAPEEPPHGHHTHGPSGSHEVVAADDDVSVLVRLSREMADPSLPPERRAEIAIELSRIAHQQALASRG